MLKLFMFCFVCVLNSYFVFVSSRVTFVLYLFCLMIYLILGRGICFVLRFISFWVVVYSFRA